MGPTVGWNSLLIELFRPKLCSNGSKKGWIRLWPAGLNWHFGAETDLFHLQCRSQRKLFLSSRVNLWVKIISRCAKTFSSASCMCVEGRLKQEKIQGCWFVDGKVPSIRMQVKWETFFLISFLNNVIESAKQKKIYTPCYLVLKPLLELLKSNQM